VIPRDVRVEPQWVTGAAAAAVNPVTGLFALETSSTSALTPSGAESLAVAIIRLPLGAGGSIANFTREDLESDRGAPIAAWDKLLACGRPVRAETPFGASVGDSASGAALYMRARWSVTLCGPARDPQVTFDMTDIRSGVRFIGADVDPSDAHVLRLRSILFGLPLGEAGGTVPSPEAAVEALWRATGVPVSQVPRAHLYWRSVVTVARRPLWELELATGVQANIIQLNGLSPRVVSRVYAQFTGLDIIEFFVPADTQPPQVWMPFLSATNPLVADSIAFPVIRPIEFRRVLFP
jgi:hypothetical protein